MGTTVPITSQFDGATTDFDNEGDLNSVSNAVVERSSFGKIEWIDNVDVDGQDLDAYINISSNFISLDAVKLHSSLNSSANLSFYNLTLGYPKILKDGKDCSDCSVLSWDANNGNVVFNVIIIIQ